MQILVNQRNGTEEGWTGGGIEKAISRAGVFDSGLHRPGREKTAFDGNMSGSDWGRVSEQNRMLATYPMHDERRRPFVGR